MRASAEAPGRAKPEQLLTSQLDADQSADGGSWTPAQPERRPDPRRIQNDTYRTLAIRYETSRVEANRNAQKISAATVIAAPMVPDLPARPRRKLVALATMLAALLLAAAASWRSRLRRPVQQARDVTRFCGCRCSPRSHRTHAQPPDDTAPSAGDAKNDTVPP